MSDRLNSSASPYFAAVDLGSNSFHMIIARIHEGEVDIIDREKEMVQIARGITAEGYLGKAAQERALACLTRFAERLRDIPRVQIRAVGTKALRSTSQSRSFLKAAEQALGGVAIQIISGYEEARLVYTGLVRSVLNDHNQRLVVDIGGGSTELIIGKDDEPLCLESLSAGCVTYTQRFMGKRGKPGKNAMRKAYLAACTEVESLRGLYLKTGWAIAYGTSGTVKAIADLCAGRDGGAVITRASLDWLAGELVDHKAGLDAVPALRREVLPAGVAILQAVFEQLRLETLHVGDAALKEGLLYDTIGRLRDNRDTRQESVYRLQRQYRVDQEHASRVAQTATHLWRQIDGPALPGVSRTKVLTWAAQLHEIGMSISHSSHHNHGYYILRHSDIAGFGRYEQYSLASLVRSHRKNPSRKKFEDVDELAVAAFVPILVCLRLAVLLHRRRDEVEMLPSLKGEGLDFHLRFPKHWLADHPLTLASLQQEQEYYEKIGVSLSYR